jgi:hypothetical protein
MLIDRAMISMVWVIYQISGQKTVLFKVIEEILSVSSFAFLFMGPYSVVSVRSLFSHDHSLKPIPHKNRQ